MKNKEKFRHLESFKDIEAEKMQLYYSLHLTEKKLQLSLFNIRDHFSIERILYNIFLNNVVDPLFNGIKQRILNFFGKGERRKVNKKGTKK